MASNPTPAADGSMVQAALSLEADEATLIALALLALLSVLFSLASSVVSCMCGGPAASRSASNDALLGTDEEEGAKVALNKSPSSSYTPDQRAADRDEELRIKRRASDKAQGK